MEEREGGHRGEKGEREREGGRDIGERGGGGDRREKEGAKDEAANRQRLQGFVFPSFPSIPYKESGIKGKNASARQQTH